MRPADLTWHMVNGEFASMVTSGLYNEGTNAWLRLTYKSAVAI